MSDGTIATAPRRRGRRPGGASDVKERALRAAREVFSEYEYDAATVDLIASRIGVTQPAVTYHFKNKGQLYRAALASAATSLRLIGDRALRMPALRTQLRHFVEGVSAEDSLGAFLVSAAAEYRRHPYQWEPEYAPLQIVDGFIADVVREAVHRGELPAHAAAASYRQALTAMILGLILDTAFTDTGISNAAFDQFVALLDGNSLVGRPEWQRTG